MRLISQDGMIDVPYEQVAIELKESEVWCEYSATVQSYCTGRMVAKYTTEAKALKVMEMLREQYMKLGMIKILASGTCEYMDKSLEKEEKMGIYADYCRKHCFKFPADEEVEV